MSLVAVVVDSKPSLVAVVASTGAISQPADPPEPPTVRMRWATLTVAEEQTPIPRLLADLSFPWIFDIDVTFELVSATATANQDFVWPGDQTVTIPAGSTFNGVLVPLIDDATGEAAETATFGIATAVETSGPWLQDIPRVNPVQTVMTIQQSDGGTPTFNFSEPALTLEENEGSIQVAVTVSADTGGLETVEVNQTGGDAVLGTDYTLTPTVPQFNTGVASVPLTINALEVTETKTAILELENPSGSTAVGASDTLVLTIQDESPFAKPILRFDSLFLTMGEVGTTAQSTATVNVVVDNAASANLSQAFTAQLAFTAPSSQGAVLGEDYEIQGIDPPYLLEFGEGTSSLSFQIQILSDTLTEGLESFQATLTAVSNCSVLEGEDVLDVEILDFANSGNGAGTEFGFTYASEVFGSDTGTVVTLRVFATSAVTEAVDVFISSWSPNASVPTDYDEIITRVRFGAGSDKATATFNLTAAASASSLKWIQHEIVDVRKVATAEPYGDIDIVNRRFLVIVRGDTDTRNVAPPNWPLPGPDDIEVTATAATVLRGPNTGNTTVFTAFTLGTLKDFLAAETYVLWKDRNSPGIQPFQRGAPVVVKFTADIVNLEIRFNRDFNWEEGEVRPPVRDLYFYGDTGGGTAPVLRAWRWNNTSWYTGAGVQVTESDNIAFVNIDFTINSAGTRECVTSDGTTQGHAQGGIFYLQDCDLSTSSALIPDSSTGKQGIRMNHGCSLWLSGCTFDRLKEHAIYNNQSTGLTIIRDTDSSDCGRSFFQGVSRPGEYRGPMSHGLLAIYNCTSDDHGTWDTGAKIVSVYGHAGEVYVYDRTYTGVLEGTAYPDNKVGGVTSLARGLNEGNGGHYYVEWPAGSGDFWNVRKFVVDNDAWTPDGGDTMRSDRMNFSGVYDLTIGSFTTTGAAYGDRPVVVFNGSAERNSVAFVDQRGYSAAVPTFLPNRDGGVTFDSGSGGPTNGSLLAYSGVSVSADAKYSHWVEGDTESTAQDFQDNTVNTYDGGDPF